MLLHTLRSITLRAKCSSKEGSLCLGGDRGGELGVGAALLLSGVSLLTPAPVDGAGDVARSIHCDGCGVWGAGERKLGAGAPMLWPMECEDKW